MSMCAVFVQVEDADIARFEAAPESVERLFTPQTLPTAGLLNMTAAMQERLQAKGPQSIASMISNLPEPLRRQIEERLGHTVAAMASGEGGVDFVNLMRKHLARRTEPSAAQRDMLSLDKAWHGVHYLLSGAVGPGADLRSQAVMGGVEIGDDPEGFSGYGPARFFRAAQIASLSEELGRPELESEAAGRFDPVRMSELKIYPGFRAVDKEWLMSAFRSLRDFYASAATNKQAVVTSLV